MDTTNAETQAPVITLSEAAMKEVTTKLAAGGYKFSTLVIGIAESMPFQMRRSDLQGDRKK